MQSLTLLHWTVLGVFGFFAAASFVFAVLQLTPLVVLNVMGAIGTLLLVQIYGVRVLSRRVRGRSAAVVAKRSPSTAQPAKQSVEPAGPPSALSAWAANLRSRPGQLTWFTRMARETKNVGARDVLALTASSGALDYRALMRAVDAARVGRRRSESAAALQRRLWKPALFSLARVLYSQRLSTQDLMDCLKLYELAEDLYDVENFLEGQDRSFYADLLTWDGQTLKAEQVLSLPEERPDRAYSQAFLGLNAVNPVVTRNPHKAGEWLGRLNEKFEEAGFAPLSFKDPQNPSFYEIVTNASPVEGEEMPLVTVIMPIYEPNEATDVAIRSLLNQTWSNLEILIVDDASPQCDADGNPTGFREQLTAWESEDDRIRVVFCEENRGAYSVRNDAFDMARGDFVTIADKDDWHHPQRIEYQARDLRDTPEKAGNIVNWVRVDESMKFLVRWGPDRVIHPSFASIMYRTQEVKETLGYWDPVRKSADNEYRTRFELAYGTKLIADVSVPLAFSLLGEGNLTSNDFGLGYRHPDREIYQDAYRVWHENITAGASSHLDYTPGERRWVAPPSFLPQRNKDHIPHYDVVYLSEFGLWGGNTLSLLQEIEAALAQGLSVGIIPLQNGLISTAAKRRMIPELQQMFLDGRVDRLTLDRKATAGRLIIHWPPVVQLLQGTEAALVPQDVIVVANRAPAVLSAGSASYDLSDVAANVAAMFGRRPRWAAPSPHAIRELRSLIPTDDVLSDPWDSPAEPLRRPLPTGIADGRAPMVGRPWSEEEANWPEPSRRDVMFPRDGAYGVSLRANLNTLYTQKILARGEMPESWSVRDHSVSGFAEYLDELDFLLVHTRELWDESVEPSIVAALRAGVVCIAPAELQEQYGDALVYAGPKDVPSAVSELWEADLYAAQQERGFRFLEDHRTAAGYAGRVKG